MPFSSLVAPQRYASISIRGRPNSLIQKSPGPAGRTLSSTVCLCDMSLSGERCFSPGQVHLSFVDPKVGWAGIAARVNGQDDCIVVRHVEFQAPANRFHLSLSSCHSDVQAARRIHLVVLEHKHIQKACFQIAKKQIPNIEVKSSRILFVLHYLISCSILSLQSISSCGDGFLDSQHPTQHIFGGQEKKPDLVAEKG